MNELFSNTIYFGVVLSLIAYFIGVKIKEKTKLTIMNPLLVAIVIVILFLVIFKIDYETFDYGAKYITFFMTPATVALAIPLYRQLDILKKNYMAIFIAILSGCLAHLLVIVLGGIMFDIETGLIRSILPKSVTTPIALGIVAEIGGIETVTILGVMVAGLFGAIIAPVVYKALKIEEPIAQGLALGTASHAVGTSKAVEMGDVQAAMSSLAIVVTGIMTVIIIPVLVKFF